MRRSLPPIFLLVLRLCLRVELPRARDRWMPPWSSTPPLLDPPDEDDAEADADPDGVDDEELWTVGDIAAATGVAPRRVVAVARCLGFDALVFDREQAALILSALDGSTPPRAA